MVADGSGSLEILEVVELFEGEEDAAEFIAYVDQTGDMALSLDEWMTYFFGFWRIHPGLARRNVAFLMQRAAEMQTMPSRPPPSATGDGAEAMAQAEAEAATKVQALIRGKTARKEKEEQAAAATKMQARVRGKAARK